MVAIGAAAGSKIYSLGSYTTVRIFEDGMRATCPESVADTGWLCAGKLNTEIVFDPPEDPIDGASVPCQRAYGHCN